MNWNFYVIDAGGYILYSTESAAGKGFVHKFLVFGMEYQEQTKWLCVSNRTMWQRIQLEI